MRCGLLITKISVDLLFFELLFSGYCRLLELVLLILFLVAMISLSPRFCMKWSSCCIDVTSLSSKLSSHLPTLFLDRYSLSKSSLGCNALCIVINFLVLWSICFRPSLVHFKNGPEYITRKTAQVFIHLIRFLLNSFVSGSSLGFFRYSFLIFLFISPCLIVLASDIPNYLYFFFSPTLLI